MHRGRRKEPTFLCDADRYGFIELFERIHTRFGVEINGYCLMGNHYHMLIHTPEGQLQQAMQYLNGVYTQRFNRRHGIDGSLFRGRYASKLVETDGYLDRLVRYIHRNPIDLGFGERLVEYQWSSYPSFLYGQTPSWLFNDAIWAGGWLTPRQLRHRTETAGVVRDLDPENYQQIIGSEGFIAAALRRARVDDETVGHHRAALPRPSLEDISSVVKSVLRSRASQIGASAFDLKLVSLGLSQELGGLSLAELAERFGYNSPKSAGAAVHRFRQRLEDPVWALTIEQVRQELLG